MQKRYRILLPVLLAATVLLSLAALCMGQFSLSVSEVIRILAGRGKNIVNGAVVVWNVRVPRICMSLVCGAGLAVAGAAFQALFSNPLATADTLGCANGASFGAALGILLGFQSFGVQFSALLFGMLSVLLVFAVTKTKGNKSRSMMMIILGGMVISSLFSSLVSLIKYVADPNDVLPVITFWLMGSFSNATMKSLLQGGGIIIAGTLILYLLRYRLNILSLSEEEAKSLGLDLKKTRFLVIASSSMITSSVVSMCGVIGWVGLLIPHIARMLFGNNNVRVIPACIVIGALFMVGVDTVARCAVASEIPVSILTSVIGAPVFLLLLRKTGGIRA